MSTRIFERERRRGRRRSTQAQLHAVAEARRISRDTKRLGLLFVQPAPVQRQEEEVLAVGEDSVVHLHAGGMRLDHADQGVPLPGLYLIVVEEFVGRMRLCSGRPAACQKALDW